MFKNLKPVQTFLSSIYPKTHSKKHTDFEMRELQVQKYWLQHFKTHYVTTL